MNVPVKIFFRHSCDVLNKLKSRVYLAVAEDAFDGVLFCAVLFFSHELSWMRSGTELSQFLRIFLPTLS